MHQNHIKEKIIKLPKILQITKQHAKHAKKSLGQNFLIDETIVRQIIDCAAFDALPILEIGPGIGALTREIIYKSNGTVPIHLIEKDEQVMAHLQQLQAIDSNIAIHHADALKFDEAKIASKIQIIANLPYNIGTQLLLKWVNKIELFSSITVMLQNEVAKRIIATPNTSAYGSLSIFMQLLCNVEHVLDVSPHSFIPRPKVNSAVIKLTPKALPPELDLAKLNRLVKMCFTHRRKMIKHTMVKLFKENAEEVCKKCNVTLSLRPEQLSINDYIKLSKQL